MTHVASEDEMKQLGAQVGALLRGGEVIELVGDVGAGKTTFVKGLAIGLDIDEPIQSPSFTISRTYDGRDKLQLVHYDFYRLDDAGIMASDVRESTISHHVVTVVEWADIVVDVLPAERLTLQITPTDETGREVTMIPVGERADVIAGALV